jgi:hypothetical protein
MKKPREAGAFFVSTETLALHLSSHHCCPVGFAVEPMGTIIPTEPLLLKRLLAKVLTEPELVAVSRMAKSFAWLAPDYET